MKQVKPFSQKGQQPGFSRFGTRPSLHLTLELSIVYIQYEGKEDCTIPSNALGLDAGGYDGFSQGRCAQVRNRWRTLLFFLGQQAVVATPHGRGTLPVRRLAHPGAKLGHRPVHLHIVLSCLC